MKETDKESQNNGHTSPLKKCFSKNSFLQPQYNGQTICGGV